MTNQTRASRCLGGSPAGASISRLCTLTLVAAMASGPAMIGFAQTTPDAAKPAKQVTETKAPAAPGPKIIGGYAVHQEIELGGRIVANQSGSDAMWATMVNQSTGMRVLSHTLEMHSLNPSKTPFFNTLTSSSFGYGGDPYDVSYLNLSKGRIYDFAGSFRRDRNYFDYNLLANSLLSNATPATPVLVPQPDSLHIFNTVRRNTDTLVTLLPLSRVSFRAGFNHGTNEGPTLSTLHGGGDVQLSQWFRNSLDTYTGGVDVKLAKRTTLSYDQFYAFYKGDTSFQLAPTPFKLSNGTPVSLGVDVLTGPTVTCGTGANKTENVVNGIANPFCSGTTTQSEVAPMRTSFPTEQLRFASHYWDAISMNGRVTYSGGTTNVNSFNETFIGNGRASACPPGVSSCVERQEIETGAGANGQFAHNKRINVNADYGLEAELSKNVSITDAFNFWDFRIPSFSAYTEAKLVGPTATTSMLTPLTSGTLTSLVSPATFSDFLSQQNTGNTVMGIVTVTPEVKVSGGWRFNDRQITFNGDPTFDWHQNWLLLGGVVQPSHAFRLNVNYDIMHSKSANSNTMSNTYTREAPNVINDLRLRMTVIPAKWINFAVTGNDYSAKNDDPLVNHFAHNHDISFAAQVIPTETLSLDFNYAYDDVFSTTDLCYVYLPTATAPLPPGATNAGTCVYSPTNPGGSPTPPGVTPASTTILYLGNGYYNAPETFFSGTLSYTPAKYFRFNGGVSLNYQGGQAEQLNPLMVPGALNSKVVTPFTDLLVKIAPQWAWHGNWIHHAYTEAGGPGPAPRNFHGDVITLGVQYAF
ncbi:MAG: hypothetical protein WB608_01025 [Terracidiphilus sp.]